MAEGGTARTRSARALTWAVVLVLGALVAVGLRGLAGAVDDSVARRASADAQGKLDSATAAVRQDVLADPDRRGEELAAAVSRHVEELYQGVVTGARATGTGAVVDAYVDGSASHPGGVFGTELTRRLCVRIVVEPAAEPAVDVRSIRCSGVAADLPPGTEPG